MQSVQKQKEEAAITMLSKEEVHEKARANPKGPSKEDQVALPGCSREGIVYAFKCLACREEGSRRQYIEETLRSGFQRAKEYIRGVREGIATHPIVIHFEEEHGGQRQKHSSES